MDFCSWCPSGRFLELLPPGPGPHTCGGKRGCTQVGMWLEVARQAHRAEHGAGGDLSTTGALEGGSNVVGAHSPGMRLAVGIGGGGVLEVPCFTGNTVAVSLPSSVWQEKGKAGQGEWAKGCSYPAGNFLDTHWVAPFLPTGLILWLPRFLAAPLAELPLLSPCTPLIPVPGLFLSSPFCEPFIGGRTEPEGSPRTQYHAPCPHSRPAAPSLPLTLCSW